MLLCTDFTVSQRFIRRPFNSSMRSIPDPRRCASDTWISSLRKMRGPSSRECCTCPQPRLFTKVMPRFSPPTSLLYSFSIPRSQYIPPPSRSASLVHHGETFRDHETASVLSSLFRQISSTRVIRKDAFCSRDLFDFARRIIALEFIQSSMISGARNCTLLQYLTSCTILSPQLSQSSSTSSLRTSSSSSSCRSSRTLHLSRRQPPPLPPAADFFSRILFWRTDRRGYLYLKVEQKKRASFGA